MAGMFSNALRSFNSPILSNYKLAEQPTSTAGPWKIFDAKHKTNGKTVSVFVFDKKTLEPNANASYGRSTGRSAGGSVKRAQEEVVERLRKEASSLARLRHPSILELVEPVEDTRSGGLMFATEPVTASLAGLLSEKDGQERRGGRFVVEDGEGNRKRREIEIDELDIQKGLLQIAKGIEFLHESAGLIHGNITPDAVVINSKSDWKITGLGFSGKVEGTTVATSAAPMVLNELLNFDPRLPRSVQLNLDYSSPDFILDNNACQAADMFSLGILIIALYNSPHKSPLETNMSISAYERMFSSSSTVPSQTNNFMSSAPVAKPVQMLLSRLITRRPAQRLSAKEFQQAEYFDNILVSTIRFLESLPAKTQREKSQFLRGLPRIMPQFSSKVLERKVLPALLDEMKDRELIALILQNVFKMIKGMPSSKRAFPEKVIPKLRETFIPPPSGKRDQQVQPERDSAKEAGLMVILENMQLISDNTTGSEFKDEILPIIHFALDSPTHSLVDAALGVLPVILSTLDYSTIKNEVFPVIAAVFSKTSSMGIKIRGLEALKLLCGGGGTNDDDGLNGFDDTTSKQKSNSVILDKYTVQEKVVPLLKAIKTKEPAVMLAALDVFKEIAKLADAEFLAMEVLPILWNFSLGPLLNLQQFQSFMSLIKGLSAKVESEHTRKLQELSASNPVSASRNDFMTFGGPALRSNGFDEPNGDTNDFEALVLGKGGALSPTASGSDSFDIWNKPEQVPSNHIPLRTSRQASPAPTFAWSTPSPTLPSRNTSTTSMSTASQPMSAFSTLQPTQPNRPISTTSQPINWSSSTTTPATQSTISNPWSTPSATTPAANPWNAAPIAPAPNLWAQPAAQPTLNQSFNQPLRPTVSSQSSFAIPPPPRSPYTAGGIAPPPAVNAPRMAGAMNSLGQMGGQQQRQQQPPPPPPGAGGLDKYESLL
ncbi:kinase-like protein [Microthyrium microscopicum]|uniref:Kinase-like protein n=1 Tax=Microthyrium microscopicum TaxID=703497 RepID=A0A6A6U738_9PEZI|nr:kinase-like protein [Microthyrium microscopicum]